MCIMHSGTKGARSASIRRVHFDIDGMPVLDLVEERDLVDAYKMSPCRYRSMTPTSR